MQTLGMNSHQIYIVDFFASWCNSCKKEMPLLSKVNSRVNHAKIRFIGINADKNLKKGKAFQKKMRHMHALNFKVINDPNNRIIKRFAPTGMPALYIIKNGKVIDMLLGARSNLDTLLERYLKKL